MADYAYYIGESIGGLVHLVVGVRLLSLSVRNSQTPDRLLSVVFLFWTLSYLLFGIPWILLGDEELIPRTTTGLLPGVRGRRPDDPTRAMGRDDWN